MGYICVPDALYCVLLVKHQVYILLITNNVHTALVHSGLQFPEGITPIIKGSHALRS